ncbi:MAG: hypothetical protein ACOYMA_16410, partial [Bacteroidia bacterium]
MRLVLKSIILLCWLIFFGSCTTLINPNLKRRAVISVDIEQQSFIELEKVSSLAIKLNSVLNNGRESHDWTNFIVETSNCTYTDGVVYFHRNNLKLPNNFISIKVIDNTTHVSDSLTIEIPLLTKIEIKQISNASLQNGFEVPFILNAIYSNGKSVEINNKNEHDNFSGHYIVKVEGKTIDFPYVFNVSNLDSFHQSFYVKCEHSTNSALKDSTIIPIKYDGHYQFLFKGNNGQKGQDGSDSYRRYNNNNGYPGQNGQNGQNGAAGFRVYLLLKSFEVDSVLYIKAIAYSGNQISTCIFNAKLGQLTVSNSGGDGGNGGEGGSGSDGRDKTEKEAAGNGGTGGEGGNGGDGGKGGQIKVFADS